MKMKLLTPEYSGKGTSTLGITIKGDSIFLTKSVANVIGLTKKESRLHFSIGGDNDDRLYLLNESQAEQVAQETRTQLGAGWAVNGTPDRGQRYIKTTQIIRAAKLGQDGYPIAKDENGFYYVEFNANAPEPKIKSRAELIAESKARKEQKDAAAAKKAANDIEANRKGTGAKAAVK